MKHSWKQVSWWFSIKYKIQMKIVCPAFKCVQERHYISWCCPATTRLSSSTGRIATSLMADGGQMMVSPSLVVNWRRHVGRWSISGVTMTGGQLSSVTRSEFIAKAAGAEMAKCKIHADSSSCTKMCLLTVCWPCSGKFAACCVVARIV